MVLFKHSKTGSRTRRRSALQQKDTWDLSELYPSLNDWKKARKIVKTKLNHIQQHKGKLGSSSSNMLACLKFNSELSKDFNRLYNYASMLSDQDTRDAKCIGMKQEISQLLTDYRAISSFIEPELIRIEKETVDKFISEESGLIPYKMYLYDIQRMKAHKLSEKEEKIIADAGLITDGPYSIYTIFSHAELPYPDVTLSSGKEIILNQAGYARYRALSNRKDRETVFKNFWGAMGRFKGTFGAKLYSNVKKDIFYSRVRKYKSSLASALDQDNVPEAVYLTLIDNVNKNLDTFHRYLQLRKRMLNVDRLEYSDLYAPVVRGIELEYDIEDAKRLVLESLKPLGMEYINVVKRAFRKRWIDVYPTTGKRSGAYCNDGAYDIHPFILLNYNEQFNDVSTLAHEIGHAMHTYFSNKAQPYPTSEYSIFVAEVASTLNEALLLYRVKSEIRDDDTRLSLFMEYLDNIRGTVFRQTQFAEFELRIHEEVEKGNSLTGDVLTKIYEEILKKYYGHEKGICHIDRRVNVEWTYIPHLYYNFYVYQYATAFTASTSLAEKVIQGENGAVDKYIAFLSSGGSDYPISILKKAGVDITGTDPFDKTMKAMIRTMDELERILDKKGL
jgi:oligoendopeptidase F